jgi:hypothetical protein
VEEPLVFESDIVFTAFLMLPPSSVVGILLKYYLKVPISEPAMLIPAAESLRSMI